jgi:hypothetical protein
MAMDRRHRRPPVRAAITTALLVATTLALATADGEAAIRHITVDLQVAETCADPAPSQRCAEAAYVETYRGRDARQVWVSFTADLAGCSPVRLHFVEDGRDVLVTAPLWPGESVRDVPLGEVRDRWRMWAEGVEGGCNAGHLGAWGGRGSWQAVLVRDRR